jgi:hypothetical protein
LREETSFAVSEADHEHLTAKRQRRGQNYHWRVTGSLSTKPSLFPRPLQAVVRRRSSIVPADYWGLRPVMMLQ